MLNVDTTTPVDALERQLLAREALISRLRIEQAEALRALDVAQVHRTDGSRSMVEWVMARLDVTDATASDLLRVATLAPEHPDIARAAEGGEVSFDRAVATMRLAAARADEDVLAYSLGCDLNGVARLTARRRRMTRGEEVAVFDARFLAIQPNLDESSGRLWRQLPGVDLQVVTKALHERADELRRLPGPTLSRGQRMADALVTIAQDSLDGTADGASPSGSDPLVTVFVDMDLADRTAGEAGVEIECGPKAGPLTLEHMLCTGRVQLVGLQNGRPVVTSDATRQIPPAVRSFVARRDGGCAIAGCRSRYRLQPHHVAHRANGGDHDPDNLVTLCWFHHHVVIHGMGFTIDPDSPPQRRRFMLPAPRRPDPP